MFKIFFLDGNTLDVAGNTLPVAREEVLSFGTDIGIPLAHVRYWTRIETQGAPDGESQD